MPDRKEIVITINENSGNGNGESGNKKGKGNEDTSVADALKWIVHPVSSATQKLKDSGIGGAITVMTAQQIYNAIGSPIRQAIEYSIQRTFNLYDNYVMEKEVNSIRQSVDRGINIGKSIGSSAIGGAIAGAKFGGPVGAVIGAVASATTTAISSGLTFGIEVAKNKDQAKLKLQENLINTNYNGSRAGLMLTTNTNTLN